MRDWRKLYKGITESDKIAIVSDGAALLFAFLIARQDDAGRYPWTPAKVRALIITRNWSQQDTDAFLAELVQARLVTVSSTYGVRTPYVGMVEIVDGAAKNGPPTAGPARHRKAQLYDAVESNPASTYSVRTEYVPEEKRREEKRESFASQTAGAAAPPPAGITIERDEGVAESTLAESRRELPVPSPVVEQLESVAEAHGRVMRPSPVVGQEGVGESLFSTLADWQGGLVAEFNKPVGRNPMAFLARAHCRFHGLQLDKKQFSILCGRIGKLVDITKAWNKQGDFQAVLEATYRAGVEAAGPPLDFIQKSLEARAGANGRGLHRGPDQYEKMREVERGADKGRPITRI